MTESKPSPTRFRVAHLSARQPTAFTLTPDAPARAALAQELGISALPKLRFSGRIRAIDGDAWAVEGRLEARATQPCVVTLAPVTTDLAEDVASTKVVRAQGLRVRPCGAPRAVRSPYRAAGCA